MIAAESSESNCSSPPLIGGNHGTDVPSTKSNQILSNDNACDGFDHKDSNEDLSVPFNVFHAEAMEVFESKDADNDHITDNGNENSLKPITISWGRGDFGSLFRYDQNIDESAQPIHTFGNRQIIHISSNTYHSVAVTSTGELYVCGNNDEGQVDPNAFDDNGKFISAIYKPRLFDSLGQHRVCYVSCGLYHTVCVTATGHAISFGGNESGQLGHSPKQMSKVLPRTVDFKWRSGKSGIIDKVSCGDLFTLFLTTSGDVYSCGTGECTGHNASNSNVSSAEKVEALLGVNIVALAAGSSHSLALSSTGEMYAWGLASNGQLGIDELVSGHVQMPTKVSVQCNDRIIGIAAGFSHSLLWTDSGALFGSGMNKSGQLGLPFPRVLTFSKINILSYSCVSAVCGNDHSLAICYSSGESNEKSNAMRVLGWGLNTFGQVTKDSTAPLFRGATDITDSIFRSLHKGKVVHISAGGDQSFATCLQDSQLSIETNIASFRSDYNSFFKRQFSTMASRAVGPLDSATLSQLIAKSSQFSSQNNSGQESTKSRELGPLLSTAGDLFASPALLAGSFIDSHFYPLYLDINAIENCYKALLQLGTSALVRLQGAMHQSLSELESSHSTVPESAVRVLLIIWQFPANSNAILSADIFKKLLLIWKKLPHSHQDAMIRALQQYPQHLLVSRILSPLHEHLSMYIESSSTSLSGTSNNSGNEQLIRVACECLDWLYQSLTNSSIIDGSANSSAAAVLSKDLFYNNAISDISDQMLVTDFFAWRQQQQELALANASTRGKIVSSSSNTNKMKKFYISQYPFLLSVQAKHRLLLAMAAYEQQQMQKLSYNRVVLSGQQIFIPFLVLYVQRQHLLQNALTQVASCDNLELKKPLKVVFDGEEGVDAGGVTKEFFQLLITQLLSVEYGMFVSTYDGRALWLNKDCSWCSDEYRLVGTLLGLAMYNGVLLDIHFPMVLYRKLLQYKASLDDLLSIDSELCHGLRQLLQYTPEEDVEYVFCRTFEVEWDSFGTKMTHELIPNGANVAVTGQNRKLYVEKYLDWLLNQSIAPQFQSLYDGFIRVIDPSSLLLLRGEELEALMVGTPHLDFSELENHTEYISADVAPGADAARWGKEHPIIQAFWRIVHNDFSFEQKQKLLLFVTGSKKAPLGGLKNLGFKIQRMCPDGMMLPTSHTCFNLLMLPEYSSKEKLRDLLSKAIDECEGFGLK